MKKGTLYESIPLMVKIFYGISCYRIDVQCNCRLDRILKFHLLKRRYRCKHLRIS